MRKAALLPLILYFAIQCGPSGYEQGVEQQLRLYRQVLKTSKTLVSGIENAQSAESTASFLDSYSKTLENTRRSLQQLKRDYPGLAEQEETPPEVQQVSAELGQEITRLGEVLALAADKYSSDPVFRQAHQRFLRAVSRLK